MCQDKVAPYFRVKKLRGNAKTSEDVKHILIALNTNSLHRVD